MDTTLTLLAIAFTVLLLTFYVKFLWKRRRLYWLSRNLPGPFAVPFLGSIWCLGGNVYEIFTNIMSLFNKYPGIFKVWLGSRLFYFVSEPKYLKIILPNCLEKEKLYGRAGIIVGHGIFTAPYGIWRRNRKIISPTFNQKILDAFLGVFSDQSNILVEQLKKYDGKGEFDVFHLVSNCALDIICETAMGVKVNAQTTHAMYPKWTDRLLEIIFLRMFLIWYKNDTIFNLTPLGREANIIATKMHEFSGKVVKEKKAAYKQYLRQSKEDAANDVGGGSKRKAFLDYLIELTNADDKFSEEQLRNEVDTFIIGGSDTSATITCFLLTMLGLHQDIQEQVYREVIETVGEDRPVEPEDLRKLNYLERVIKETMRLFPTGGVIVRYIDKDVDLGDHIVPSGVSVIIGILRVHTNETYWPDPYKFDPDRFLPEEVSKRPTCSYIPFSYGPRDCIGLRYAMMVMKALAVAILRRYRIYTHYKAVQDVKLQQKLIIKPRNGYKVHIESR